MSSVALLFAASLTLASSPDQAPPQAPPAVVSAEALGQAYFLFVQAQALEDAGDVDGAIAAYRQVLAIQPGAADVHAQLATIYARAGKASEAIAEALEALKSDPDNRGANRVMGFVQAALAENATDTARQTNLVTEAIGHFERALAGGRSDLASQLALSRLYVQTGQPQKAIPTLRAFLDDRPDYAEAILLLADAYEGAQRLNDAVAVVEGLVADQPADTSARSRLASLYEETARWKDAAAAWGELSRRNPQILGYRTRRATALVNAGDVEGGRQALLAIVQDTPRDISIWYLLSQAERRAGHAAAAEEAARHIAEIDPADPRGPLALAEVKIAGKDYRGAIAALEPFVAAARDADIASGAFGRAANQLAIAFEGAGERDRALRALEDARRRAPGDDEIALNLASAYERAQDLGKAEATFRDVIARDASNAEALNDLGYMLADHGQKLDEAVGLIKRALVIEPDNPSFLDSLGWAYVKHGKPEDGRPSLERAAVGLPRTSVILDHLGEAYYQLKRYKDAAGAWDRSLAGDMAGVDAGIITRKRDKARELAGK